MSAEGGSSVNEGKLDVTVARLGRVARSSKEDTLNSSQTIAVEKGEW